MLRKTLIATTLFFGLSGIALAAHCPAHAKEIDQALTASSLSAAEKQKITAMRDEGMKLHNAGSHGEAEETLHAAMRKMQGERSY